MVKLHNELRIKHDSPPLNENEELNNIASSYAKSLANNPLKGILQIPIISFDAC